MERYFNQIAQNVHLPLTWIEPPLPFQTPTEFIETVDAASKKEPGPHLIAIDSSQHDLLDWSDLTKSTVAHALKYIFENAPKTIYIQVVPHIRFGNGTNLVLHSLPLPSKP